MSDKLRCQHDSCLTEDVEAVVINIGTWSATIWLCEEHAKKAKWERIVTVITKQDKEDVKLLKEDLENLLDSADLDPCHLAVYTELNLFYELLVLNSGDRRNCWCGEVKCPFCSSTRVELIDKMEQPLWTKQRYECVDCRKQFFKDKDDPKGRYQFIEGDPTVE